MEFYSDEEADAIQAALLLMENAGLEVQHVRMFGAQAYSILVLRRLERPEKIEIEEVLDGSVE